ncbi:MAG TPA: antibiotic biosynthesis monooxygenase family protein [Burkholderiales bacterium]|nr:antibiotic biosynthesis monooxygenase family protein [Burkholderiales bacterium]
MNGTTSTVRRVGGASTRPIVVVNTFTPKPGALEEFIALQTAALPGLSADLPGFRGSRLYRADDGGKAVLVSVFETAEDFRRFMESDAFRAHRERILPLLDRADPGRYETVYEAGRI